MDEKQLKNAVLQAFVEEKLKALGYELDDADMRLLADHTVLEERPGPESEEMRSVEIKEAVDGKVTASMFSLYNISQLSVNDLLGFLLTQAQILAMGDAKKIAIVLALLSLVREFYKALDRPLSESEAKVLLAIHALRKKVYSADEVRAVYESRFKTAIDPDELQRYLEHFVKMTLLREEDRAKKLYSNRQSISLAH